MHPLLKKNPGSAPANVRSGRHEQFGSDQFTKGLALQTFFRSSLEIKWLKELPTSSLKGKALGTRLKELQELLHICEDHGLICQDK